MVGKGEMMKMERSRRWIGSKKSAHEPMHFREGG